MNAIIISHLVDHACIEVLSMLCQVLRTRTKPKRNKFSYAIDTSTLVTPEFSELWSDDSKDVFLVTRTNSHGKVKRYQKILIKSGAATPCEFLDISH